MVPENDAKECRKWALANVTRGPIVGDVYTTWHDDHHDEWNVHGLIRQTSGCTKVLMLTDGFNCHIWMHEWDELFRKGSIRFLGRNHLYAT